MKKRPKIKGRGADIYLGGDAAQNSDQRPKKSPASAIAAKPPVENNFDALHANGKSICGLDSLRRAMAWQIRTGERLAVQTIEQQEMRAQWAQDALLVPWFEAQVAIARTIIAQSAAAARNIWRIRD